MADVAPIRPARKPRQEADRADDAVLASLGIAPRFTDETPTPAADKEVKKAPARKRAPKKEAPEKLAAEVAAAQAAETPYRLKHDELNGRYIVAVAGFMVGDVRKVGAKWQGSEDPEGVLHPTRAAAAQAVYDAHQGRRNASINAAAAQLGAPTAEAPQPTAPAACLHAGCHPGRCVYGPDHGTPAAVQPAAEPAPETVQLVIEPGKNYEVAARWEVQGVPVVSLRQPGGKFLLVKESDILATIPGIGEGQ